MNAITAATTKSTLHPGVVDLLRSPGGLLIDGESVPALSGRTFDVVNPADECIIAFTVSARGPR